MNSKRKFQVSIVLALAALLISTFSAWAHPAEGIASTPDPTAFVPCRGVIERAEKVASGIDIPARWADYVLLENSSHCLVVAGVSTMLIPNTGLARKMDARFAAFKDRQAEARSFGR